MVCHESEFRREHFHNTVAIIFLPPPSFLLSPPSSLLPPPSSSFLLSPRFLHTHSHSVTWSRHQWSSSTKLWWNSLCSRRLQDQSGVFCIRKPLLADLQWLTDLNKLARHTLPADRSQPQRTSSPHHEFLSRHSWYVHVCDKHHWNPGSARSLHHRL